MKRHVFAMFIVLVFGGFMAFDFYSAFTSQDTAALDEFEAALESESFNIEYVETIPEFTSTMRIQKDGKVRIEEEIVYDFGQAEKHGIYREIPRTSVIGTPGHLKISDIVLHQIDDETENLPYTTWGEGKDTGRRNPWIEYILGSFLWYEGPSSVEIKIGDPDKTITGAHTYRYSYTVERALGYFDDRDELYWNVTGNGWNAPIERATGIMVLPGVFREDQLHIATYCGILDDTTSCGDTEIGTDPETGNTTVTARLGEYKGEFEHFASANGMTIAVGFPKGVVPDEGIVYPAWLPYLAYWYIPASILLALYLYRRQIRYYLNRRRFYRDNTVVVEYDADELTALEASMLMFGGKKNRALSAEIIWLATHGYIIIEHIESDSLGAKEYSYKRTEKNASGLPAYTLALLEGISNRTTTELENSFYVTAQGVVRDVCQSLTDRGYLESRMKLFNKLRVTPPPAGSLVVLFCFLAINPGFFIYFIFGLHVGLLFAGTMLSLAVSALVFGGGERLTEKGLHKERMLRGLKQYIDTAEDERIKFHNAPDKNPETFEKLLPYAMIFGLERDWAKAFEGIYTTPPTWYHGSQFEVGSFNATNFASSVSSFSTTTTSALTSSPSGSSGGSSGGGSSGGGGGGGGGGSW